MGTVRAQRASADVDVLVSSLAYPGLGDVGGVCSRPDGTLLATNSFDHTVLELDERGGAKRIAGRRGRKGLQDGPGDIACFDYPTGILAARDGNIIVVDWVNHALRCVSRDGTVSTLCGNGEEGFVDGEAPDARFYCPHSVVQAASAELVVADCYNNAIRVVTPTGTVRTLCGNGQAGFSDGTGTDARFNRPTGLAWDSDGTLLVADADNHAVRRVTMAGAVSTVAGTKEGGCVDGPCALARFNKPTSIVVDGDGVIVVADSENHRLRRIALGLVTTLCGSGKCISTDGLGASASFAYPYRLAMDERGRLLVAEAVKFDSLRMVEAGLAPPPWSEWEKCGLMLAFMGVFHARLGAQSTAKPLAALGSDDVVRGVLWPLLVRS